MTRRGGQVRRFHTEPLLKDQNLAAHSFGVAALCLALTTGQASKNLICAALFHDMEEQRLGDTPAPAKSVLGAQSTYSYNFCREQFQSEFSIEYEKLLTDEEKVVLRWADMLEFLWKCVEERTLGNQYADAMMDRGLTIAKGFPRHELAEEFVEYLTAPR